jgi:hypothetical protein
MDCSRYAVALHSLHQNCSDDYSANSSICLNRCGFCTGLRNWGSARCWQRLTLIDMATEEATTLRTEANLQHKGI